MQEPFRQGEARGQSDFPQTDRKWSPNAYQWDPYRLAAVEEGGGSQYNDVGVAPQHWTQQAGNKQLPRGPLLCQVSDCGKDLLSEKTYYQRHRICCQHLKMLSLVVDGRPSRFCQQCGKFHDISDFDGDRRSCRARLAVHNARRRKRDPSRNDQSSMMDDAAPHWNSKKQGPVITVDLAAGGWQASLQQSSAEDDQYWPSSTESGAPSQSPAGGAGTSTWTMAATVPYWQQAPQNLGDGGPRHGDQSQQQQQAFLAAAAQTPSLFVAPQAALALLQMQQQMQTQEDTYSPAGAMSAVPRRMRASDGNSSGGAMAMSVTMGQESSALADIGRHTSDFSGQAASFVPPTASAASGANGGSSIPAAPRKNLSSLEVARALMEGSEAPLPAYIPDDAMVRISLKVANCTPEQLPPDLFCRLRSLLLTANASTVQGFLRPGCTHLLLDICLHGRNRSASELPPELFSWALGQQLMRDHDVTMQSDDGKLAVFQAEDGDEDDALPLLAPADKGTVPLLTYVTPAAAVAHPGGRVELLAAGYGLLQPGAKVLLRTQGGYVPVQWAPADDLTASHLRAMLTQEDDGLLPLAAASLPLDVIKVTAAACPGPGLAMLEVEAPGKGLLSNWMPVVLAASAYEVSELSRTSNSSLLLDYGHVLDYVHSVRLYRHDLGQLPGGAATNEPVRSEAELQRLLAKANALLVHCKGPAGLPSLTAKLEGAVDVLIGDLHEVSAAASARVALPNGSAYRISSRLMVLTPADELDEDVEMAADLEEEESESAIFDDCRDSAASWSRSASEKDMSLKSEHDADRLVFNRDDSAGCERLHCGPEPVAFLEAF